MTFRIQNLYFFIFIFYFIFTDINNAYAYECDLDIPRQDIKNEPINNNDLLECLEKNNRVAKSYFQSLILISGKDLKKIHDPLIDAYDDLSSDSIFKAYLIKKIQNKPTEVIQKYIRKAYKLSSPYAFTMYTQSVLNSDPALWRKAVSHAGKIGLNYEISVKLRHTSRTNQCPKFADVMPENQLRNIENIYY